MSPKFVHCEEKAQEYNVCFKAFMSIYDITNRQFQTTKFPSYYWKTVF